MTEIYIIDSQGIIRYKHIGPLTPDIVTKEMEPLVKDLNASR